MVTHMRALRNKGRDVVKGYTNLRIKMKTNRKSVYTMRGNGKMIFLME